MAKQIDFIERKQMVMKEVARLQGIHDATAKELEIYEGAKPPMLAMANQARLVLKRQRMALENAQARYAELNAAVKP